MGGPIKSPWEITTRATPGVIDANDLILFAPQPGIPFVTQCQSTTAAGIVSAGGPALAFGTYTPTYADFGNIAAATPILHLFIRIGNIVQVTGLANVQPGAAGPCTFSISVPIATVFGGLDDASGMVACVNFQAPGIITGVGGFNRVFFNGTSTTAVASEFSVQFMYRILP